MLIIDGSREPANAAATAAAVAACAAGTRHTLQYVGRAEAACLREQLTPPGSIRPSIEPGTAGENRNLLLVLTAGEDILAIDDDVLCETWAPPARLGTTAVMGHRQELLDTRFFETRELARRAAGREPVDLLACHGALLGRSLPDLIAESHGTLDLTHSCGHIRSALREDRPLVVKATFSGVAGDAGTYCPYRLLFAAGPLRDRLWADPAMYGTAMSRREVARIAPGYVVTHDCSCMTTCMGLSNQSFVPPFMPLGRNEDGLFGEMLAACEPSALFGHVPCGVIHDSHRPAARDTRLLSATQSRVSDLIALLLRALPVSALASPAAVSRLGAVGRRLMELGESDIRTLEELVGHLTSEARARELAWAEQAADCPECPAHWRAGLAQYREVLAIHARLREFFLPIEFRELGSLEAGYRALRTFLAAFGRLIESWPALWDRARTLNDERQCAGGGRVSMRAPVTPTLQ